MREKVKSYKDLEKIDRAFVINTNDEQYNAAKTRWNERNRLNNLESRLNLIERDISRILDILTRGSNDDTEAIKL